MRTPDHAPSADVVAKLESELLAAQARRDPNVPFASRGSLFRAAVPFPSGADRLKPGTAHTGQPLQLAGSDWLKQCSR